MHDFSFLDSFSILAECVSGVRVQSDCKSCQTTEEGNVATQSTSDTNGKVNVGQTFDLVVMRSKCNDVMWLKQ